MTRSSQAGGSDACDGRLRSRRYETVLRLTVLAITSVSLIVFIRFFGADLRSALTLLTHRASVAGLAVYLGYSLGVLALLGAAWLAASGEAGALLGTFVWARIVRDAAADLLPFSQLGAIVISFRIVLRRGMQPSVVYASFIADLTTELVSQFLFTLFGAAVLVVHARTTGDVGTPIHDIVIAVGAIALLAGSAATAGWTLPIARRLVAVALPGAAGSIAQTCDRLQELYRRRARITAAFVINAVAWLASGAGAWLGLRLLDVEVDLVTVLGLESLIFALRSVAFAVPGGLGVQEAGYGILGPLLGIPVEAAVLVALLKRVRDVAIGLPVLTLWQAAQLRRLTARA